MTSRQNRQTGAPRRAGRGKIAAAFVALSAAGALGTGEAAAGPFCTEGWAALEVGAGSATGDLGVSGNYGPPASGGDSFTQAIVGIDAGVRVDRLGEGMGGMTNVAPPPQEVTDQALREIRQTPCKGPVIGVRGRLPVDGEGTTRQAIHPFPSALTSIGYEAQWMLTLYLGYMLMLQTEFANNPLAFTPWAGVTVQRGELSMTTDELGTVSHFSEDVTRVGPSVGLNVDVPLDGHDDMFFGVGIQGDFLPEASAMGTSPSFSYRFSRDESFEFSGFARLGVRW